MAPPNSHTASGPVITQSIASSHFFPGEYYQETPNQPGQYFASSHYAGAPSINQTPVGATNGSIPPTPGSLAGSKRSRGDINGENDEDDVEDGSTITPQDSANSIGQSQWNEGRRTLERGHSKRPSISSRKSLRKEASSATCPDDLAHLLLPPQIREATREPLIDEATRALGISWVRMDSTEALRINKAAYSRWIQAHYPSLKDVAVWLENSALPGYLVEAKHAYSGAQGYYLFSNDLTQARLVTTESAQLVPRLRLLPALHLAAPGGHTTAETDPITAAQNEISAVQGSPGTDDMSRLSQEVSQLRDSVQDVTSSHEVSGRLAETNEMRSAHEMELD
ncbi:hypothetical protein LTR53_009256 [Teratosphaeriaceae sp. CCFEE 6253]|nr:hypothetical protein LTR53_009256 [Teratosphaeriaceae sp. CCFEE 6253]